MQELDALKKQGNEAFKAGKADLAFLHYNQAQVPCPILGASQVDFDVGLQLSSLLGPQTGHIDQMPSRCSFPAQRSLGQSCQKTSGQGSCILLQVVFLYVFLKHTAANKGDSIVQSFQWQVAGHSWKHQHERQGNSL